MNSLFLLTTNKLQRHYRFTTDLLQTGEGTTETLQKHYRITTERTFESSLSLPCLTVGQ